MNEQELVELLDGSRIVIEKACPVHGKHDQPPHTAYGGCIGSSSRVLDPRLYRTDAWTKRTVDRINALALEGVEEG